MFKKIMKWLGWVPLATHLKTRRQLSEWIDEYNELYDCAYNMSCAYNRMRDEYQAWLNCYHPPVAMKGGDNGIGGTGSSAQILPFKRPDVA